MSPRASCVCSTASSSDDSNQRRARRTREKGRSAVSAGSALYVVVCIEPCETFFDVFRPLALFLVRIALWRRGVEGVDVGAQIVGNGGETVTGQAIQQLGV